MTADPRRLYNSLYATTLQAAKGTGVILCLEEFLGEYDDYVPYEIFPSMGAAELKVIPVRTTGPSDGWDAIGGLQTPLDYFSKHRFVSCESFAEIEGRRHSERLWINNPKEHDWKWIMRCLGDWAKDVLYILHMKGMTPMARKKGKEVTVNGGEVDGGVIRILQLALEDFDDKLIDRYPDAQAKLTAVAALTEAIMKQPHLGDIDWLGVREIARLVTELEEIDALGVSYTDPQFGHLRARLSKRLGEWLSEFGLTPKSRHVLGSSSG